MKKKMNLKQLCRCYSNGGADPAPAVDPTPAPVADSASASDSKPTEPTKAFTQADIDDALSVAIAKLKQEEANSKDYEKMTPEQKVAFLEAERADTKLSDFARGEITKASLPVETLPFLKGKDEAETTSRITSFKTIYDTAVQTAVEARFKSAGYDPAISTVKLNSAGDTLESAIAGALNLK